MYRAAQVWVDLGKYPFLAIIICHCCLVVVQSGNSLGPEVGFDNNSLTIKVDENAGEVNLTVLSSRPFLQDTTIHVSYIEIPPTKRGVDFIGDDNFTMRASSQSATFTVKIVDNSVFTGSAVAHVFYIILNSTDPFAYQVESTTSLTEISIVDDDSAPVLGFEMTSFVLSEDGGGVNLTVNASQAFVIDTSIILDFTTVGPVEFDVDFKADSVLFLPANSTTISFLVTIVDNANYTGPTVERKISVHLDDNVTRQYTLDPNRNVAEITILDDEECSFRFIDGSISPGQIAVNYEVPSGSTVHCKADDRTYVLCPIGTTFQFQTGGTHCITFNVTCFDGLSPRRDLVYCFNVPEPPRPLTCNGAQIRELKRRSNYASFRNVFFTWRTAGDPHNVTCQIGGGSEIPCRSPFHVTKHLYESLCSKRHTFTVRAYCNSQVVHSESTTARLFTGVACKPGCRDITFTKTPTISVDKTKSGANITVNFRTSPAAFCFCKELTERRNKNCKNRDTVTVGKKKGVFVVSCEAKGGCNTIIRHYLPY